MLGLAGGLEWGPLAGGPLLSWVAPGPTAVACAPTDDPAPFPQGRRPTKGRDVVDVNEVVSLTASVLALAAAVLDLLRRRDKDDG